MIGNGDSASIHPPKASQMKTTLFHNNKGSKGCLRCRQAFKSRPGCQDFSNARLAGKGFRVSGQGFDPEPDGPKP